MSGWSSLVAKAALWERAGLAVRGGASEIATAVRGTGRAVLLTLAGWTAGQVGEASGVGEDTVRCWRTWFTRGGVAALRATLAPGPAAGRAERDADLRVQARKAAMSGEPLGSTLGALDALPCAALVHAPATKRGSDLAALPRLLDQRCGLQPGQGRKPAVLVPDNSPIHASKAGLAALAARSAWLAVEWLPRRAPELNPIESTWRDFKVWPVTCNKLTAGWFGRRLGFSLGLANVGIDLGAVLMPALAGCVILAHGWRAACVALGVIVVAVP